MPTIFQVEDELHSEEMGSFENHDAAVAFLKTLAAVPWGTAPNLPPCTSRLGCARWYIVSEFAEPERPVDMPRESQQLWVSAAGVEWLAPGARPPL